MPWFTPIQPQWGQAFHIYVFHLWVKQYVGGEQNMKKNYCRICAWMLPMGTRALPRNFWIGFLRGSPLAWGNGDCLPSSRGSFLAENVRNCLQPIPQPEVQIRWLNFAGWCFYPPVCPPKNLSICWQGSWRWWDGKSGFRSVEYVAVWQFSWKQKAG